ncbi:unnamed protein product [Coregonus sp. 'balchen']|nr:unnamed protein product [Coregonus sp. 'balchen']
MLQAVKLLLLCGANKEHSNVSHYTPLSLAASGGYINILQNAGAEINSRTRSTLGISPLMLADMNNQIAAVQLLLNMVSDIITQIETNRNTGTEPGLPTWSTAPRGQFAHRVGVPWIPSQQPTGSTIIRYLTT